MRNLTFVGVLLAILAANLPAADEATTSSLKLQVMTSESKNPVPQRPRGGSFCAEETPQRQTLQLGRPKPTGRVSLC